MCVLLQVHHIVTAMLVWLYGRQEYAKQWAPVIIVLLVLGCYRLPIVEYVYRLFFIFIRACYVCEYV